MICLLKLKTSSRYGLSVITHYVYEQIHTHGEHTFTLSSVHIEKNNKFTLVHHSVFNDNNNNHYYNNYLYSGLSKSLISEAHTEPEQLAVCYSGKQAPVRG